jgi:hypothetical protein
MEGTAMEDTMKATRTAPRRCSLAARDRGDEMFATAPPARRFLLLEVPGPWAADLLPATGLTPRTAQELRSAVGRAGARMLLIRRPGRHPVDQEDRSRRWAVVERDTGIRWGDWQSEADLEGLDVEAEFAAISGPAAKPVVLICTQGRHDVCCAIEGRPVAAAAAADDRVDAWECSHLGGDRFAANLLHLPSGLLFGGLTAQTTPAVLDAVTSGRVLLEHFRGRYGDAAVGQAAQWFLMQTLQEDRPENVRVVRVDPPGADEAGQAVVAEHSGQTYRLRVASTVAAPQHLTCRAQADSRVRYYHLVGAPVAG